MHAISLSRVYTHTPPANRLTTVVVPCFNEARRISAQAFHDFLSRTSNIRFLLVNDGSTDGTLACLVEQHRASPQAFAVLDLPRNVGKSEAVRQGMLWALEQGDYAGFWDADLATPLGEIPRFVQVLDRNPAVDVVVGARLGLSGRTIQRRRSRRVLGWGFATVVRALFALGVCDSQCGAKLFRAGETTRRLFAQPFRSKWIFDVELLDRMRRLTPRPLEQAVYELPLDQWREVAGSKLSTWDMARALGELATIRFHAAKDAAALRRGAASIQVPAGTLTACSERGLGSVRSVTPDAQKKAA